DACVFRPLRTYMREGTGEELFAPPYRSQLDALARESLRDCLAESEGIEPLLQRVAHLFLSQRSRHETALSLTKLGSVVETRLPYLDNEPLPPPMPPPPQRKPDHHIPPHLHHP